MQTYEVQMTNTCPSFRATKNILDDQYSAFVQPIIQQPKNVSSKCHGVESGRKLFSFSDIQKNILNFPQCEQCHLILKSDFFRLTGGSRAPSFTATLSRGYVDSRFKIAKIKNLYYLQIIFNFTWNLSGKKCKIFSIIYFVLIYSALIELYFGTPSLKSP